jgi:hypothetical protein
MFVKRNAQNEIILISKISIPGIVDELIDDDSYELVDFLDEEHENTPVVEFKRSDRDLIRVLEDVIDLLTVKGVIQFTDLPKAAQEKLLSRQNIRHRIATLDLLSDDPDTETINLDM